MMKKERWQALITALSNPDEVEKAVQACLALAEEADPEDIPRLYQLLESDDSFFRECAADPLARLAGIQALPALMNALTKGREEGHDNDGLCTIVGDLLQRHPKKAFPLLSEMLQSSQAAERENAAWGWGYIAANAPAAPLISALRDSSPHVRANAAGSLASYPEHPRGIPALLTLLNDPNPQVRISCIAALRYVGGKEVIPALEEKLADPSDRVRRFAQTALEKIKPTSGRSNTLTG
jgi:HEAT repeat protein